MDESDASGHGMGLQGFSPTGITHAGKLSLEKYK